MATTEFVPNQAKTEGITAHVIWLTTGLSCEGDSVAMTGATNPSLEDIITGAIPACRAWSCTTRCSPSSRARSSCRRGTTPRPASSIRSC